MLVLVLPWSNTQNGVLWCHISWRHPSDNSSEQITVKQKWKSRRIVGYIIFILYKTLLEYFSTTVYLLFQLPKLAKLLVLKPSESIHENSRFIRGNLRSRKISFANVNARKSTANLSVNTTFDIKLRMFWPPPEFRAKKFVFARKKSYLCRRNWEAPQSGHYLSSEAD